MRSQRPEAGGSILILVIGWLWVLIGKGGDVVEVERHRGGESSSAGAATTLCVLVMRSSDR